MQFISHGPDIPDSLLEAHADGRVVFFCGAGISRQAGLPDFKGLIEQIYKEIGTHWEKNESEAFKRSEFDVTLNLLEQRVGGRGTLFRPALLKILNPNLKKKGAKETHSALLELSRNREGSVRLVTTNFDRIFHRLMRRTKTTASSYVAPFLPIPKNSRWNGVVYLHGLLPETDDKSALDRLVFTSGDFGLAYLVERWAARFVSELFRNYVVCFVGYSISDPVLRYMMDALAADRMLGEMTTQAYAFGDFCVGDELNKKAEWESKGVKPILYEVRKGGDHSLLHRTFKVWAETYRDGVQGSENIVAKCALTRPAESTKQDDFVGRMLWALTHSSGLPARYFANFVPTPSLEWLGPLFENRFRHADLRRFWISPNAQQDKKLKFSVLSRPAPYTHAPWMALVSADQLNSDWDPLMGELAKWLLRHLNDPALVLWLGRGGGKLHHRFASLIQGRMSEINDFERTGKTQELDKLRRDSPEGIPSHLMRIVWRFLLTGRVKGHGRNFYIFTWEKLFNRDGLTSTIRLELRKLLSPKIALHKPFSLLKELGGATESGGLNSIFRWKIELSTNHVRSYLRDVFKSPQWVAALPRLLADFQQLLVDALELAQELCEGESEYDSSYLDLPSISSHWQNRGYYDWVLLVELLRDAWTETLKQDLEKAKYHARDWISLPHPTFKRLALFAAAHDGIVSSEEWVEWVIANNGECLWQGQKLREVMRLIVLQGRNLSQGAQSNLERAILAGPCRSNFRADLEQDQYDSNSIKMTWLRLKKLELGGVKLGSQASKRLRCISAANPTWKLDGGQLDEFVVVMSGTGDPDYASRLETEQAPRQRKKLVEWLRSPRSKDPLFEDDWRDVCRSRFKCAIYALFALTRENIWHTDRWTDALQIWSDEKLVGQSWRRVSRLLQCMPDSTLTVMVSNVSFWLEQASKQRAPEWQSFVELCRRILRLQIPTSDDPDRSLIRAINHPVGHVTQSILNQLFMRHPSDGARLPEDIKNVFTELCVREPTQNRHGWVILASHVITLFRLDQDWTTKHLLPFFCWDRSTIDAGAAWEAYLYSPHINLSFMEMCKKDFLVTAEKYRILGECGRQYAAVLTHVSLDHRGVFTSEELSTATRALPEEGLQECAKTLFHALTGSGKQRKNCWKNRIQPYWRTIWPKSLKLSSPEIAESLARLTIAALGEFPDALRNMISWLQPFEDACFIIQELHQAGLSAQFPEDTLSFLDAIIGDQFYLPKELDQCLESILAAKPGVQRDHKFQRLRECSRKHC